MAFDRGMGDNSTNYHVRKTLTPPGGSEMSGPYSRESPFPAWIIKSKIEPEEQMASLIGRPRLIQRLKDGLDRKLTLIAASAGYGKTALMSRWRRDLLDQGIKVAWLSLDEDDNRPGVLATYSLFSLHSIGLRSAIDEMSEQDFGPQLNPRSVVGMLATAVAMSEERFVLMLDGFESLKAESTKSLVKPLLSISRRMSILSLQARPGGCCPCRTTGSAARLRN